jgi:hypothetical protein
MDAMCTALAVLVPDLFAAGSPAASSGDIGRGMAHLVLEMRGSGSRLPEVHAALGLALQAHTKGEYKQGELAKLTTVYWSVVNSCSLEEQMVFRTGRERFADVFMHQPSSKAQHDLEGVIKECLEDGWVPPDRIFAVSMLKGYRHSGGIGVRIKVDGRVGGYSLHGMMRFRDVHFDICVRLPKGGWGVYDSMSNKTEQFAWIMPVKEAAAVKFAEAATVFLFVRTAAASSRR